MATFNGLHRSARKLQNRILQILYGEAFQPYEIDALQTDAPDNPIASLLERSPWLRAEVDAGRVNLSTEGTSIHFHYAPSYFLNQATLLASNAYGMPKAAVEALLQHSYAGYNPAPQGQADVERNQAWAEGKAQDYEARLAQSLASRSSRPARNRILSTPAPGGGL